MKKIGLKKILLLSVMLLVGLSVSISSSILYFQEKETLIESIIAQNEEYVAAKATIIETLINEKVSGIHQLAQSTEQIDNDELDSDIINKTEFLAKAMNLNSAVIAFDNGSAYWNQTSSTWPNHKYDGDATSTSWYKAAQKASTVTVTEPYLEKGGKIYWLTIIEKMTSGTIAVDMTLEVLNDLVKQSNDIPGAVAMILNHDTTILASSSPTLKTGSKGAEYSWFKDAAQTAVSRKSGWMDYVLDGVDKTLFFHRINAGDKQWYFTIAIDDSIALAKLDTLRNVAVLVAGLSTVISVIIAFVLINILYRPILSLKVMIDSLSSGDADLTQRLRVESNDELGSISKGINRFIQNLQEMMREIELATTSLHSNIQRMQKQSVHNNEMLQSHVSETEQVVTAIEEMNATAESMANDAANTASLTEKANTTSIESRQVVEQAQHTISALIADVDESELNVQKMKNETESINSILDVIGEIAEQTNLLALNAAIEAARAGEQGRGFAVVADEVRNLASRTKESTSEVEIALEQLLNGTQLVVNSMEVTKTRCEETANGSGEVSTSLSVMSGFVDDIHDLSTQIATAAEEQSSVTQELSRNMSAINGIVNELDANGQQALQDAQSVSEVNDRLLAIVGRFKI